MRPEDLEPLLASIAAECTMRHPAEACGLVLSNGKGSLRFVAIPNIAGTSMGSVTSERAATDGFVMEPKALMRAIDSAESEGGALLAIVHSHPEVGAYFSSEDRKMALGGGTEPLWPGVDSVVVSVRAGPRGVFVDDAKVYHWNDESKDFEEAQIRAIAQLS